MKPVRIVMTIFFIILSSLNFHKLLTEGGYRGGKVYVVATTQSRHYATTTYHRIDPVFNISDKSKRVL